MADISQELQRIGNAVTGLDIRGAIYNSIKQINEELVAIESSLEEGISQLQEAASRIEPEEESEP